MEEQNNVPDTTDYMSTVIEACSMLWKTLCAINVRPIRLLKELLQRALNLRPVRFVMKLSLLILSIFGNPHVLSDEAAIKIIPPSRHEHNIPTVADLYFVGVKFSPTDGDLTPLQFDEKDATLYLPKIVLYANTKVILRNLVAFEDSVVPGVLVLRRYTNFMNGLIDCNNNVRLLRKSRIISNYLKNDREVASLWNNMGNCIRLPKVAYMDKVIRDLNKYYNRKWNVVMVEFVHKHIFGTWKFLSLFAILLVVTCLQAYCFVDFVDNCKS